MARLDTDRQNKLEPKRMEVAKQKLEALGFEVTETGKTKLTFVFRGSLIQFFPYSGWHTGKTIIDGRGIEKLLKQLEINK